MEENQTVFPRVADSWMANFESQLESCVKQPLQPEVLGLGEVPPLGDLHGVVQQPGVLGLGLGIVQAVKEKSRETRKESFVSLASIEKKFSMLAGIVVLHFLSDAVLLLLGFDFVKELVVLQVKDPVVLDQDLHEL